MAHTSGSSRSVESVIDLESPRGRALASIVVGRSNWFRYWYHHSDKPLKLFYDAYGYYYYHDEITLLVAHLVTIGDKRAEWFQI